MILEDSHRLRSLSHPEHSGSTHAAIRFFSSDDCSQEIRHEWQLLREEADALI